MCESPVICDLDIINVIFYWYFTKMGFVRYNKWNIPCQCGYPDEMYPLGRMVFPRAPPSGKPSSLGETFHHYTHTGMAYLYNVLYQCIKLSNSPTMSSHDLHDKRPLVTGMGNKKYTWRMLAKKFEIYGMICKNSLTRFFQNIREPVNVFCCLHFFYKSKLTIYSKKNNIY